MISRLIKLLGFQQTRPMVSNSSKAVFRGEIEKLENRTLLSVAPGLPQFEIGMEYFSIEPSLLTTPSSYSTSPVPGLSETRLPPPFLLPPSPDSFFKSNAISVNQKTSTLFVMLSPTGFLDNNFQDGFSSIVHSGENSVVPTVPGDFDPSDLHYLPAMDVVFPLPLAHPAITPFDPSFFDLNGSMPLKPQSITAASKGDIFLAGIALPPPGEFPPPLFYPRGYADPSKGIFPPYNPAKLFTPKSLTVFVSEETAAAYNEGDFLNIAQQESIGRLPTVSSNVHVLILNGSYNSHSSSVTEFASLSIRERTPDGMPSKSKAPSLATLDSSVNSRLKQEFDAVDEVMASLDEFEEKPSGGTKTFASRSVPNESPVELHNESIGLDATTLTQANGMVLLQATGDPNSNEYDLLSSINFQLREHIASDIAPSPKMEAYYAFDIG